MSRSVEDFNHKVHAQAANLSGYGIIDHGCDPYVCNTYYDGCHCPEIHWDVLYQWLNEEDRVSEGAD